MDVSIIIICHHTEDDFKKNPELKEYLDAAYRSAFDQDFKGSKEILVIRGKRSMPANTNYGVRAARGEYVKWLHYDDLLTKDCLTKLWQARGADVIVGAVAVFGDIDPYIHDNYLPDNLQDFVERNPLNQVGMMYKRQVLLDNPLDESLWTAEEYELNLRLWAKGYDFQMVNALVGKYRVHEHMKTASSWCRFDLVHKEKRRAEIKRIQNLYR